MKRSDWNILICVLGCAVLVSCGAPGVPIPPSLGTGQAGHRSARGAQGRQGVPGLDRALQDRRPPVRAPSGSHPRLPQPECARGRLQESGGGIPAAPFPVAAVSARQTRPPRKLKPATPICCRRRCKSKIPPARSPTRCQCRTKADAAPDCPTRCRFRPRRRCPRQVISAAELKNDGVLLSWDCPPAPAASAEITYKLRIYRREQGKQTGDQSQRCQPPGLFPSPTVSALPEFLDQTFEWEKHYDYRATVVTVVSGPGKPEVEVEGDDTPAVQVFAHDVFPRPCPPACRRFSRV